MEVHEGKVTTRDVVIIDKRGLTSGGGFVLGVVVAVIVLGIIGYWLFGDYIELFRAYNYK